MSTKTKTPIAPRDRRLELVEAGARIDEAEALGRTVEDLRRDIGRMEQQRDKLAALGNDRVEIAQKSYHPEFHIEVEWEPVRSRLTGKQLATRIERDIVPLRQEVASVEARIAGLLA